MSTNDYQDSASNYAERGNVGTDSIAFDWLGQRFRQLKLSGNALDVGCGTGRSTRFLKSHGMVASGVDISLSMVEQARSADPAGSYTCYAAQQALPFSDDTFDLVLSTWVVLELDTVDVLQRFMRELGRVLRTGGRAYLVANTPEFYAHQWRTCDVGFPENRAPLRVGQSVKARLLPEDVIVTDIFWDDAAYRDALTNADLQINQVAHPLASDSDHGPWLDETRVAPWVIYEAIRV